MSIVEGDRQHCPSCQSPMYFAEERYRCSGRCGFHTASHDAELWRVIVNLRMMLNSANEIIATLSRVEKKHEGKQVNYYKEVLGGTVFRHADALDEI